MDAAARSRVRIPHIIWNYVYSVYLGHLLLLEGLEVEGRGGNGHHDPKKDDHGQNGRALGLVTARTLGSDCFCPGFEPALSMYHTVLASQ